jgi:hypothetical protein
MTGATQPTDKTKINTNTRGDHLPGQQGEALRDAGSMAYIFHTDPDQTFTVYLYDVRS